MEGGWGESKKIRKLAHLGLALLERIITHPCNNDVEVQMPGLSLLQTVSTTLDLASKISHNPETTYSMAPVV